MRPPSGGFFFSFVQELWRNLLRRIGDRPWQIETRNLDALFGLHLQSFVHQSRTALVNDGRHLGIRGYPAGPVNGVEADQRWSSMD